jgi:hypothetical protein
MNGYRAAEICPAGLAVLLYLAFSGEQLFGQSSPLSPQDAARGFYHVHGPMDVHGLPDEKQRRALSPFLSADLLNLLARAQEIRDAISHHVNPPNTPLGAMAHIPGYEGDYFTSNSEHGARTFALGQLYRRYGVTRLPVYLTCYDTHWNDELVFRQTGVGWVIDNIEFTSDRRNELYGTCPRDLRQALRWCLTSQLKDRYRGKRVSSMLHW